MRIPLALFALIGASRLGLRGSNTGHGESEGEARGKETFHNVFLPKPRALNKL